MTTLYIMAGLPASGKSHIAESICKKTGAEIICKDDLREQLCGDVNDQSKNKEIHQIYLQKLKEELMAGRSVIADATNIYVGNKNSNTLIKKRKADIRKWFIINLIESGAYLDK